MFNILRIIIKHAFSICRKKEKFNHLIHNLNPTFKYIYININKILEMDY